MITDGTNYYAQRKLLFICKSRCGYSDNPVYKSIGLLNSAALVVKMLKAHHVDAVLAECNDGNGIDALIAKHKPTGVILEALWVTPEKIDELKPEIPEHGLGNKDTF